MRLYICIQKIKLWCIDAHYTSIYVYVEHFILLLKGSLSFMFATLFYVSACLQHSVRCLIFFNENDAT